MLTFQQEVILLSQQLLQHKYHLEFVPLTKCVAKFDGTTIDDTEDLDLVMPMYILIEYNSNYPETTGRLWFYSKDGATDFNNNIANTHDFNYFTYQAKLFGNTAAQPNLNNASQILKNAAIVVSLKYLSINK